MTGTIVYDFLPACCCELTGNDVKILNEGSGDSLFFGKYGQPSAELRRSMTLHPCQRFIALNHPLML